MKLYSIDNRGRRFSGNRQQLQTACNPDALMFNFTFSFAAALWALPLAGVPILLHLLFKQKSPVVMFSTLRFIKSSVQQTAARRKLQKWLLLACRTLLIALLIWAIAQPVHQLTSSWLGGGRSIVAAIVVDTSYSMQLQADRDSQVTLLNKADSMVQDLLRDKLAGAKVAIFQSQPNANTPGQLLDASVVLARWGPLKPQASSKPLVDRVTAAVDLLDRQTADQKWLVVLSDFQSQEFPHPMPQLKAGRTVLLDLHPVDPHSAGITAVSISPAQPIPGIPSQVNIELTGQPTDARAVELKLEGVDKKPISQSAPVMANLDPGGRAKVQIPITLPAEHWLELTAALTADDAMNWDNQRSQLIEVPPKQRVGLLQISTPSPVDRVLALALDPSEGGLAQWPITVSKISSTNARPDAIVAPLARWPTAGQAQSLLNFLRTGHTLVVFLTPGLEQSWAALPRAQKDLLAQILPSEPVPVSAPALCRASIANASDPLLQGLTDDKFQLNAITVRQMIEFNPSEKSSAILNASPVDPASSSHAKALLFRTAVGRGTCYVCTTLPDSRFTNLATHPTFLPLLVRMVLKNPDQSSGQNVELGQPLVLDGSIAPGQKQLQIEGPQHEQYRVNASTDADGSFIFDQANEPGLYTWRQITRPDIIAITNVQLPVSESDLTYRPAESVAPPGPDTVIASNLKDLSSHVAQLTAPQPQWSVPIAVVMFLLCLEALMGSLAGPKVSPVKSFSTGAV